MANMISTSGQLTPYVAPPSVTTQQPVTDLHFHEAVILDVTNQSGSLIIDAAPAAHHDFNALVVIEGSGFPVSFNAPAAQALALLGEKYTGTVSEVKATAAPLTVFTGKSHVVMQLNGRLTQGAPQHLVMNVVAVASDGDVFAGTLMIGGNDQRFTLVTAAGATVHLHMIGHKP